MKKLIYLIWIPLTITGCASAPSFAYQQMEHSRTIDGSYDDIWSSTVQAILNHPDKLKIDEIDKESGILITDQKMFGAFSDGFMDCGKSPMDLVVGAKYGLTFSFQDHGSGKIRVRINTDAEVLREPILETTQRWYPCYSTGRIEEITFDLIESELDDLQLARSLDSN